MLGNRELSAMVQLGAVHAQLIKPRLIKANSKSERRGKNRGLSIIGPASRERGDRRRALNPAKANNTSYGISDTHKTQYVWDSSVITIYLAKQRTQAMSTWLCPSADRKPVETETETDEQKSLQPVSDLSREIGVSSQFPCWG